MIELKPIIKDDGAIIGFAELEHRVTTIDGVGQSGKTTMIVENVKDDLRNGYDILIIDTHMQHQILDIALSNRNRYYKKQGIVKTVLTEKDIGSNLITCSGIDMLYVDEWFSLKESSKDQIVGFLIRNPDIKAVLAGNAPNIAQLKEDVGMLSKSFGGCNLL